MNLLTVYLVYFNIVSYLQVSISWSALCLPTILTSLPAPPQPGATPILAWTQATRARGVASLQSVQVVSSAPPPTARPWT